MNTPTVSIVTPVSERFELPNRPRGGKLRFLFHYYHLHDRGGIERAITELSNALVADGSEVFVVSATKRDAVAFPLDVRVSLIETNHPVPSWSGPLSWFPKAVWAFRQWRRISRITVEIRPSIFVDHGTSLGFLYPFRTIAGVPLVLQKHFPVNTFPYGRVMQRFLSYVQSSRVIIALTEGAASELRSYGYRNVYVIPNTVPTDARPSECLHQSPKIGLLMGGAVPAKGFDLFLRALALQKIPGWKFIIVGPGVDGDPLLTNLVRRYQLQDAVSLLPATSDPYAHIKKASCVIMPSRYEALPMVALESLAMGRPVIASDAGGLRDIVIEGVNGRLFPCGDTRKLSECLVSTCGDEENLAKYARNAPSSLGKFRAQVIVDGWKKVAMESNRRVV